MKRVYIVLVALSVCFTAVCGVRTLDRHVIAQPTPEPPLAKSLEQLVGELADIRARKAAIEKEEQAKLAELKVRIEVMRKLFEELGLLPKVDPIPPGPKPKPDDPPGPAPPGEFRVLFLFESSNISPAHANIVNDPKIRAYLNRKTPTGGTDGKTKDYRFWDKDVVLNIDQQKDTPVWKGIGKAAQKWTSEAPGVVVFSGANGKFYPMPANSAELLALLKQHAGE